MKERTNHTINAISGSKVPDLVISYFPSVVNQSDFRRIDYANSSKDSKSSSCIPIPGGFLDRATQTSFRYIPRKLRKNSSFSINTSRNNDQEPLAKNYDEDNESGIYTIPIDTRYRPAYSLQSTYYAPYETSMTASPLARTASYEKAILSSMKERMELNEAGRVAKKGPSSARGGASRGFSRKSSAASDLSCSSTLPCRSELSSALEVVVTNDTIEKWKKKSSHKKGSPAVEENEMKLLRYEEMEFSAVEDDQKRRANDPFLKHLEQCTPADLDNSFSTEKDVSVEEICTSPEQAVKRGTGIEIQRDASGTTGYQNKNDVPGTKSPRKSSIILVNATEKFLKGASTLVNDGVKLKMLSLQVSNSQSPLTPINAEGGGGSEYPYLREMKERLLISKEDPVMDDPSHPDNQLLEVHQTPVGTVVRLNADGYGSHTSPTHRVESLYTGTLESRKTRAFEFFPKNAKTSTFITLSLLYATLLVVVCLGFVLSEVLTHNVPLYYYEAFFTYLYGLSIFFLLYVFCYLLTDSSREPSAPNNQKVRKSETLPSEGGSPTQEKLTGSVPKPPKKHKTTDNDHSHGSFFLRIGAIAFGLGTMIYNGLEFGVFFEIPMNSPCHQILRGVNPLLQLVFTFMQMYFIFMNARLNIHKFKFVARFGLMHIVATNLCIWIRTLVRESLKEINEFRVTQGHSGEDYMILEGIRRALENRGLMAPNRYMYNLDAFQQQDANDTETPGGVVVQKNFTYGNWVTEEDLVNRTCERMEIMGSIVSDSAPYLYPFIVEYSLIGAAVLYIMWKHIGRNPKFVYDAEAADGLSVVSRRCHSKVDCVGASKGLFCGLLVLVATLICLILFFVLIHQEELRMLAIYLADCSHCGIMLLSIVAIFIGFCRVRHLKFFGEREEELDDILLMVSAFGLFAYAVFSAVAGSLSAFTEEPNLLVMITGILSVIQVMIQMVFIKDSQRRQVALPEQERTKPGRQIVTFLLICNLAMWVIYTFETQKVEANPVQLEFFGKLSWTILLRCTLPLAIFHRFHSSVVLAAIWKNSYKTRLE